MPFHAKALAKEGQQSRDFIFPRYCLSLFPSFLFFTSTTPTPPTLCEYSNSLSFLIPSIKTLLHLSPFALSFQSFDLQHLLVFDLDLNTLSPLQEVRLISCLLALTLYPRSYPPHLALKPSITSPFLVRFAESCSASMYISLLDARSVRFRLPTTAMARFFV